MIEIIIHKKTESKEEIISYNLTSIILEGDKLLAIKEDSVNYRKLDKILNYDLQGSTSYEIFTRISDTLQMMKNCHKFYHFKNKDELVAKLIEVLF